MKNEKQIIKKECRALARELFARFDNETAARCLLEHAEELCRGYGLSKEVAFQLASGVEPRLGGIL